LGKGRVAFLTSEEVVGRGYRERKEKSPPLHDHVLQKREKAGRQARARTDKKKGGTCCLVKGGGVDPRREKCCKKSLPCPRRGIELELEKKDPR